MSLDIERPTREIGLQVNRVEKTGNVISKLDEVAAEEPMEIRVIAWNGAEWIKNSIAVTMRTPGNDFELSAGFLLSEGVVKNREDIVRISYCTDPNEAQCFNIVNVFLSADTRFDIARLSRLTYTSSSCGICGKGSIDQVHSLQGLRCNNEFRVPIGTILSLPGKLNKAQRSFSRTGGLHASALFDVTGVLICIREDVGRHNALDKLIGSLLMKNELHSQDRILLLSGRASFELVQKAAIAGIPFVCAVGAPSNLAIDLARDYGITLVGFLKDDHFNVYSGPKRVDISNVQ